LIAQVEDLFNADDFTSNKPLTGEYLVGYYCQRQKMWEKRDRTVPKEFENADANN
jgi:CRISPR-associated protein Csd1